MATRTPAPQANSLPRLRRLVEAVRDRGVISSPREIAAVVGLSERHADYYATAAADVLHFLRRSEGTLTVSQLGEELLSTRPGSHQERDRLRAAILRSPEVALLAPSLLRPKEPSIEATTGQIQRATGLKPSTAQRRAQTLHAWRRYVLEPQSDLGLSEQHGGRSIPREVRKGVEPSRLLEVRIARFKSYWSTTSIELAPLTVVIGPNNSGKSTWIQSLLLLKQTLAHPRSEVPLHLSGYLEASNVRELTHGWPESLNYEEGPRISIKWSTNVDLYSAYELALRPDLKTLKRVAGLTFSPKTDPRIASLVTDIDILFGEAMGQPVVEEVVVRSQPSGFCGLGFSYRVVREGTDWVTLVSSLGMGSEEIAKKIQVEAEHFVPYLSINRRNVGPRDKNRSWHNAYLMLLAQPLEQLERILKQSLYLGSTRGVPQPIYQPISAPISDVGVSGEYAAHALYRHRQDRVRFLPPLKIESGRVVVPERIRNASFEQAINEVFSDLGVDSNVGVERLGDFGFRLKFGEASVQHVGRGLNHILPVVELGLIGDPSGFSSDESDHLLGDYMAASRSVSHLLLEEPESNLHPKVQSRLAHWFVALAMSGRQLLVESHSDHFVRRLRGMIARAPSGSAIEQWLSQNVSIVQVSPSSTGVSEVSQSYLTPEGSIEETWPADFMDESVDEERAIFDARLDKTSDGAFGFSESRSRPVFEHDMGEPPEQEP